MKSKSRISIWPAALIGKATIFIFLSVLRLETVAYAQDGLPKVEIPNTELRQMTSSIVGQEYSLYIHLPRNYKNTDKTYPVLYLLDAQWDFPLENTGHSGTKAEGYTRGLQAVFARPSLKLAPKILAQYIGVYKLNPEVTIKVSTENDRLIALGPDNRKMVLHAETEKDFYIPGQYLFAHFKKDDAGRIIGFQLEQFSGEVFVQKINAPK